MTFQPIARSSVPAFVGPRPIVLRFLADQTLLTEWLPLLAAAPFLLVPSQYTLVGGALIGIPWLIRRAVTGRWSIATSADWPLRLMVLALVLSLVPSIRLDYSAPKFWGMVLGLATFYATINTFRTDAA